MPVKLLALILVMGISAPSTAQLLFKYRFELNAQSSTFSMRMMKGLFAKKGTIVSVVDNVHGNALPFRIEIFGGGSQPTSKEHFGKVWLGDRWNGFSRIRIINPEYAPLEIDSVNLTKPLRINVIMSTLKQPIGWIYSREELSPERRTCIINHIGHGVFRNSNRRISACGIFINWEI